MSTENTVVASLSATSTGFETYLDPARLDHDAALTLLSEVLRRFPEAAAARLAEEALADAALHRAPLVSLPRPAVLDEVLALAGALDEEAHGGRVAAAESFVRAAVRRGWVRDVPGAPPGWALTEEGARRFASVAEAACVAGGVSGPGVGA